MRESFFCIGCSIIRDSYAGPPNINADMRYAFNAADNSFKICRIKGWIMQGCAMDSYPVGKLVYNTSIFFTAESLSVIES